MDIPEPWILVWEDKFSFDTYLGQVRRENNKSISNFDRQEYPLNREKLSSWYNAERWNIHMCYLSASKGIPFCFKETVND